MGEAALHGKRKHPYTASESSPTRQAKAAYTASESSHLGADAHRNASIHLARRVCRWRPRHFDPLGCFACRALPVAPIGLLRSWGRFARLPTLGSRGSWVSGSRPHGRSGPTGGGPKPADITAPGQRSSPTGVRVPKRFGSFVGYQRRPAKQSYARRRDCGQRSSHTRGGETAASEAAIREVATRDEGRSLTVRFPRRRLDARLATEAVANCRESGRRVHARRRRRRRWR